MDVAAAAASLREPRRLSRVICLLGICGVLAALNLMTSSGRAWFLYGRETEFADCSDFTDEQLSGVTNLEGFVCTDYPKAMSCNAGLEPEMEPESYPGNPAETNSRITNPDKHGFNTQLATTFDPLVGSFIARAANSGTRRLVKGPTLVQWF